ncbi:hypothetical protein RSSM_01191 [Rhodopirellula sallentina SM41]|uniref:Uncharacterized protein n=1 Tax=Rhodopirellula sallentina SM41 TaxID=1263870 RepID=M5U7E0_9BACT|nr:hypothetical protein RSSM_01191 [Rhodopirellula sallentina SM41]
MITRITHYQTPTPTGSILVAWRPTGSHARLEQPDAFAQRLH